MSMRSLALILAILLPLMAAARQAVEQNVCYRDNMRASAAYRKALSGVLLQRAWDALQEK